MLKAVNLEAGMPLVRDALASLDRELSAARKEGYLLLKVIHGYGSSGVGGDLRVAIQKRLRELQDEDRVQGCIFGEDRSTSDQQTWTLLKINTRLKQDPDLGRRNRGITIVVL